MIPFTEDLSSFYATIYGGLLIGLLFDINRSLKSNFKILKYFSIVFNIVFYANCKSYKILYKNIVLTIARRRRCST